MESRSNHRRFTTLLILALLGLLGATAAAIANDMQETAPMGHNQTQPPPLVQENKTIKVSEHVYAIPDGRVNLVPNIGIIVGNRATLVVDAGMGPRNGQTVLRELAKVSKNTDLYFTTTHFHPEHMTGVQAFPANTIIIRPEVQQEEVDRKSSRSSSTISVDGPPDLKALLAGREAPPARHPFRSGSKTRSGRNHGEAALAWAGAYARRLLCFRRARWSPLHGRCGDQSIFPHFPRCGRERKKLAVHSGSAR